ncbi:MAG: ribosome silencing factor [FCB group bacterium]|nr:ribosome silencing factor [FCB group bacterium]
MPQSNDLPELIGRLALSKKAENVLTIDVRGLTSITDFFVICSADTEVQVKAIADAIRKGTPHKPWRLEGLEHLHWVLLDYIDVVVHIFKTSERNYYQLERLWSDAPIREIVDESETISDSSFN